MPRSMLRSVCISGMRAPLKEYRRIGRIIVKLRTNCHFRQKCRYGRIVTKKNAPTQTTTLSTIYVEVACYLDSEGLHINVAEAKRVLASRFAAPWSKPMIVRSGSNPLRGSIISLFLVSLVAGSLGVSEAHEESLTADQRAKLTGQVVQAITRAAKSNRSARESDRREGDALTEWYVKAAAIAAKELPEEHAPRAFLAAIGIALDDSDFMLANPLTRHICQQIEPSASRAERLKVLGSPTMFGRHDLAQHFSVSAFITAELGSTVADAAGVAKELMDVQGGGGFSFVDLAADKAGGMFAERVTSGDFPLDQLAKEFTVRDYMPPIEGLPEGISAQSFGEEYGGDSGERFGAMVAEILKRVESLPPYHKLRRGETN